MPDTGVAEQSATPDLVQLTLAPVGFSNSTQKKTSSSKKQTQKQKAATSSSASVMDKYIDTDEEEGKGPGGKLPDPLLLEVSIPTQKKDDNDGKLIFRCVGVVTGCDKTWVAPHWKARILKHTGNCQHLSSDQRQQSALGQKAESIGDQLEVVAISNTTLASDLSQPPTKCAHTNLAVPAATKTLDANWGNSLVYSMSKAAGKKERKLQLDFDILLLVCVDNIPPTKVDSPHWKKLWEDTKLDYTPVLSSTLVDSQIPREASRVYMLQLELLQQSDNLTMSFDGGGTWKQQSIYTVHVTTEDKCSFLLEGHEASNESHTGKYIYTVLKKVSQSCADSDWVQDKLSERHVQNMQLVEPQCFTGITSDSTGNTSVARELIHKDYPWVIILPDPCHCMNLLCKYLCSIEVFKPVRILMLYFHY